MRRENIDGVEHVIITSKTLPDDIVMNQGLYPASEVSKSIHTLERTLAPVEHPSDSNGQFISASDPIAIHNFHAGAFNANVRKENGTIIVDKVINVQEAMKTDRGKRLLDRVAELETSEDPRPIHTSVGVFLEVEELDQPKTNSLGQEYTWVASNMTFDHDAILLDSVGAAQPSQGVGMAVNESGEKFKVEQALVTIDADDLSEMSFNEIQESLSLAIKEPPLNGDWVADIIGDKVIFWSEDQTFSAPFVMDGRKARIVGIPIPVDRDIAYIPKTNEKQGDLMKELILNALKSSNVDVEGLNDAEIFAKYNALQINQHSSDDDSASDNEATAAVVANALKPLLEKLDGLEAKFNEADSQEIDKLASIVVNSDQYPGISAESAKKLGVDTLKEMTANCGSAYGVPLTVVNSQSQDADYDMPA